MDCQTRNVRKDCIHGAIWSEFHADGFLFGTAVPTYFTGTKTIAPSKKLDRKVKIMYNVKCNTLHVTFDECDCFGNGAEINCLWRFRSDALAIRAAFCCNCRLRLQSSHLRVERENRDMETLVGPLERTDLSEQIYRALRDSIIKRHLKPGEKNHCR